MLTIIIGVENTVSLKSKCLRARFLAAMELLSCPCSGGLPRLLDYAHEEEGNEIKRSHYCQTAKLTKVK